MKKIIILSALIFGFAAFSNAQTSVTSTSSASDSPTAISAPETAIESIPADVVAAEQSVQKASEAVQTESNCKKNATVRKSVIRKKPVARRKK